MNERVKELRLALGLSGEKFGSTLGVSRAAISNIENGNRNVTPQMQKAICREFHVNEDWLRTGNGDMFTDTVKNEQVKTTVDNVWQDNESSAKSRVLSKFAQTNEKDWENLEKLIDCLQYIEKVFR